MNRVILVGRLARNPELKYTQAAEPLAVCRFAVAVERPFAKDGDIKVDYINCIAFRRQGEVVNQYFRKGSRIGIEGRLQVSQYKDKNGNNRYSTDVIVSDVQIIDTKAENEARGGEILQSTPQANYQQGFSIDNDAEDEGLPF